MRILLVSTTAIGDTIMATPFIRAVRKHYPNAHITMFAHHRRLPLLEHNPHFNQLLPYYGKGKKLFSTIFALRKGKFDLAIVLHANDPDIVPLVRLSGAPQRIGWGESKWSRFFTKTTFRTNPPEHFLVHKKRIVELAGIPVNDLHTEIHLRPEDDRAFEDHVKPWLKKNLSTPNYIVMHAFGTNEKKWWPVENFLKMARHIREKKDWRTIFVGDTLSLELIESHSLYDSTQHLLVKNCGLRESAWIIKKARGMLTTDSGPMHMAFAVGCPTLSLFGPTHPSVHGPCFDLEKHHVIHKDPLNTLSLDEVMKKWDVLFSD